MDGCFMFGHADCPDAIMPRIEAAVEKHYLEYGVRSFYVGNRGRFDAVAARAVKRVKKRHPDIRLYLLLAYHPAERRVDMADGFDSSYYPPLVGVPRPYAITRANRYMADTAATLICYVRHNGNARNLLEYAQRRRKKEGIQIEKQDIQIENVADHS